jgi:hypothetical protein
MTHDGLAVNLRRLALFIGLSLLLHFLLMFGTHWRLPEKSAEPLTLTLTARLQPAPAPKLRRRPSPPTKTAAPPPVITTPTPQPEGAAATTASIPAANALSTGVAAATAPTPPELMRTLPRQGQIKYVLYYGGASWIVGSTLQTWNIDHNHYRFTSHSESGGLAWLFNRQRLNYESEGEVTPDGLRPVRFTVERRRSGTTEQAAANFDWNTMAITLDTPPRTVALPVNAQDIVSFMYQLGLTALQPGHLEVPVTNGWKLEQYQIEIGTEESIDTPLGKLRAIPVRQIPQPGKESIELWLATEYRMLPIRIRFFDRNGQPAGEQLVSDIRVSDE